MLDLPRAVGGEPLQLRRLSRGARRARRVPGVPGVPGVPSWCCNSALRVLENWLLDLTGAPVSDSGHDARCVCR